MAKNLPTEPQGYQVHGPKAACPPELASLKALQGEAEAAGLKVVCLAHVASPEAEKLRALRRHDWRAAVRTLDLALKAIEGGYSFQDSSAPAKLEAMLKAQRTLAEGSELLLRLFDV